MDASCKSSLPTTPNRKPSRTGLNKDSIGKLVWEQHWSYYQAVKGAPHPKLRKLFDEWLFGRINEWQKANKDIMLLINANEDIYKGPFADNLVEDGVEMECAYFRLHQHKIPTSKATLPIMGCLVAAGVDIESYFIGRLGLGIGNHRGPHFIEVLLKSTLGTNNPRARSVEGRKLQVRAAPRLCSKYNRDLKVVTRRHKMKDKKKLIRRLVYVVEVIPDTAPEKVAIMARCNKWDEEHSEQQLR